MSIETVHPERLTLSTSPAWTTRWENPASGTSTRWYFVFFLISGFCSILYELIWLRLAMAQFGVTTALVSIVLSAFMAGLGLGSWGAGRFIRKYGSRLEVPPLRLYALAELLIGCSAVLVPLQLSWGRLLLEQMGNRLALSSSGYYFAAGIWLAITLMPWCACMGATIPLAMFAIRSDPRTESKRSFSFLYLANVLGAVAGALIPLLLIELLGFTSTLRTGMVLNLAIFATAYILSRGESSRVRSDETNAPHSPNTSSAGLRSILGSSTLWLLFATGFTSMGMEVVWTRQYTPYVGTFVYSFASILAFYLAATFLGSSLYRFWSRRNKQEDRLLWLFVWLAALMPLFSADPRFSTPDFLRVPAGIVSFSFLLGFLTPMLVDRWAQGDPDKAGFAYAVNVAGCILGPLCVGFILLPLMSERQALLLLAAPWLLVGFPFRNFQFSSLPGGELAKRVVALGIAVLLSFGLIFETQTFDGRFTDAIVLRDHTATVLASGQGFRRRLLINGVGITMLTPITKMMAALPLSFLDHTPEKALVICFGMGTTHRSMLSWGISSTAVELVPSVPRVFNYYHADGDQLLKSPNSHVVIDDGRRFLERTSEQFDVIAIDPPPPVQAAGSSLLYSVEFYSVAKKRLRPDGILAQWLPDGDPMAAASVAKSLKASFPYVRVFVSIEGWGLHFLASQKPIPSRSAAELASRMPGPAVLDLVEWGPYRNAEQQLAAVLGRELPIDQVIAQAPHYPALRDDRPVNEYYALRWLGIWLAEGKWYTPDPKSH